MIHGEYTHAHLLQTPNQKHLQYQRRAILDTSSTKYVNSDFTTYYYNYNNNYELISFETS